MPIRINLLAETQAAEEARRKDPVKRAIWIGSFVIALVLLWSATLQGRIVAERARARGFDARWKNIEAKVKQVEEQARTVRDLEQKLSAIGQFTTNRMLWASTLNALQHSTVDNIHLVRLKTEQTFTTIEGAPARTNVTGTTTAAKPVAVTERIVLTLEAKDFSNRPGDQVPKFKQTLAADSYFAAQLQKTNNIQLTSLSAPNTDGGRTSVTFGYQVFFQEKERRLE